MAREGVYVLQDYTHRTDFTNIITFSWNHIHVDLFDLSLFRFLIFRFPLGIHVSDYNVSWRQCRHKPELGRGKGKRGFV